MPVSLNQQPPCNFAADQLKPDLFSEIFQAFCQALLKSALLTDFLDGEDTVADT